MKKNPINSALNLCPLFFFSLIVPHISLEY